MHVLGHVMSRQINQPNSLAHADGHVPSRPEVESKQPISTAAKPSTTVEITSQQVSAVDITHAFTSAASGSPIVRTRRSSY